MRHLLLTARHCVAALPAGSFFCDERGEGIAPPGSDADPLPAPQFGALFDPASIVIVAARANGASLTGLAMALGLPSTTLSRWIPAAAPQQRGLVRIDVASPRTSAMAAPSAPIVELSSGLRVRGLSLEDIVALHRRLT